MRFPRPIVDRAGGLLAGALAVVLATSAAPTTSAAPAEPAKPTIECGFSYGFAKLRDLMPGRVGDCLEDEYHDDENGVTTQPTTGGLLTWREAENLTSFTDGYRTWILGPGGLASRLNTNAPLPYERTVMARAAAAREAREAAARQEAARAEEARRAAAARATQSVATTAAPGFVPGAMEPPNLPGPSGASTFQARFILNAAAAARISQYETGVPASVTIAQAILESDWGESTLSSKHNNYFGIKAKDETDPAKVVWFDTWEVIDGEDVIEKAPFRAYKSAAESFTDHGFFFLRNRRYRAALAVRDDPRAFAREINTAGYATDPEYAPKLIKLMDRFNLYQYDLPKASPLDNTATAQAATQGNNAP